MRSKGYINCTAMMITVLFIASRLNAQLQIYNHPELEWQTIETDHFYIHFHLGTERTAAVVAGIAEKIYEPITSLYQHEPDGKIHFIVRDHDDESNGAAFYYDNKVEIWASAMDFELRGTHDWLQNVVTHEFSHMISMGAARKMPRQIPAVYFQWFDYEKEKRPDVIYGYPKTLISYPLAGTVIPPWFAEGIAQYQRAGFDFDRWDSHRDMVLRTAVLEQKPLSVAEMAVFGKNSLGNERVYNQGYGLTLYLAHQYGEERLRELVTLMKRPWRMRFSPAVERVLRKSEGILYDEWMAWLEQGYREGTEIIQRRLAGGIVLEGGGGGNFYPLISPDGRSVAYLTNRNHDYLSQLSLWTIDLDTGKKSKIKSRVMTSFSFSPDGLKLVYAKKEKSTFQGSHYFDLYVYDTMLRKEKRITRRLRGRYADWSTGGEGIVCVEESDGTSNLCVLNPDGTGMRRITRFQGGEQIFAPRWLGGEAKIVFAISGEGHGRDIAIIDADGTNFAYLIRTAHDERDPFPDREGNHVYFSCDKTGIFNIFRIDLTTLKTDQLTNVIGGAFMPAVDKAGRLVYSQFTADGYRIAFLEEPEAVPDDAAVYRSPYTEMRYRNDATEKPGDRTAADYDSRPYKTLYSKITFLPRLMVDYPNRLKVGTYVYGSDFLDRFSMLGGAAVNGLLDVDLFGIFEYKRLFPTLFIEAYYQVRHTSEEDIDVRFNLMEADVGADWRLSDYDVLRTAYIFSRYDANMKFQEQGQLFKYAYTYHIGNALRLGWTHEFIPSSTLSGIAPQSGRSVSLQIERAWQRFLDDFNVHPEYGTLIEQFTHYTYDQIMLDWREYVPSLFKDHSVAIRLRLGAIDKPVDSFYHLFAGGLDGIRGYPFYSIEGRRLAHFNLAYRFPLMKRMNVRFLWFQLDQAFLSIYGDVGDAWKGDEATEHNWKRDIGLQLRLGLVSFYSYPTRLFIDGAYGLDRFEHRDQTYGKAWRFYFGILFDFLD